MHRCGLLLLACLLCSGCAATTGTGSRAYGPGPIPEGKGRLILDAGGIGDLNYFILDQETDEEVHSHMPRVAASSPSAYERGGQPSLLFADLAPGTYTVVVNTDIRDDVVVREVSIAMGQETYVPVQVGRFAVRIQGESGEALQIPFLIMDYGMRTLLGRAMSSSEVRHFIVPAGRSYKIRVENSPTGITEIRSVDVSFGSVTQVQIAPAVTPAQEGGERQ